MHGKLICQLCRTYCETMSQYDCIRSDLKNRILEGIWVSEEFIKAIEMGYIIKAAYEICYYEVTQYDTQSDKGGISAEYIDDLLNKKLMRLAV